MKIKSSSTVVWYGKGGGGIGGRASSKSGRGARSSGRASYGASGFGTGGSAKAGKGRSAPRRDFSPADRPPPSRRP